MTSDLGESIQSLVDADEEVIKMLGSLKGEIELFQKDLMIVKSVGTTVNAIGAIATVLGLALVPVSGGASLGLTALGIAAGVGGSTANMVADVIDYFRRKEYVKNLRTTAGKRDYAADELAEKLELVEQVYCCLLENGVEEEQALASAVLYTLLGQAEHFIDENSYAILTSDGQSFSENRRRVLNILTSSESQICFKVIGAVGKTAGNMPKTAELVKFHGLLASVAKNTCRGVFAALGIIMSIAEIRILVKQMRAGHPCSYAVNDFLGQMHKETDNLKVIEKLCRDLEDVYIASLSNETEDEPGCSYNQVTMEDEEEPSCSYNHVTIEAGNVYVDISVDDSSSNLSMAIDSILRDDCERESCEKDEEVESGSIGKKWKVSLLKGGIGIIMKGFGIVVKVWPIVYTYNNDTVINAFHVETKL